MRFFNDVFEVRLFRALHIPYSRGELMGGFSEPRGRRCSTLHNVRLTLITNGVALLRLLAFYEDTAPNNAA